MSNSQPGERQPHEQEMMPYPKISIVTPSYNQGNFLEDTVRSVLEQGYPNLEYIIIDGGSTDNSLDIIKKYSKRLAYYVSERDRGQTEAINKGLRRITGDVWSYLCSDDTLTDGTLRYCAEQFRTTGADIIYGNCNFVTVDGIVSRVKHARPFDRAQLLLDNFIWQPSVFLKRGLLDEFGYFDESLRYAMDYEYWLRVSRKATFNYVNRTLSNYRLHIGSKTIGSTLEHVNEARQVKKKYGAGFRADWAYFNFRFWGLHSYRARRLLFEWLARRKP
jgi:glycosyltransferase involved in cell wall biosynthesis